MTKRKLKLAIKIQRLALQMEKTAVEMMTVKEELWQQHARELEGAAKLAYRWAVDIEEENIPGK